MNYLPFWVASEERLRLCWHYICHMYTLNYILKLENWAPGSPPSSVTAQKGLCCRATLTMGQLRGPLAAAIQAVLLYRQRHPSQQGKCPTGCGELPLRRVCSIPPFGRALQRCQGWPGSSRCHRELLGRAGTQPQLLGNGTSAQKFTGVSRKARAASCGFIRTLAVQGLRWKLLLLLVLFPQGLTEIKN